MKYKIGDIVVLKSGGFPMTIEKINPNSQSTVPPITCILWNPLTSQYVREVFCEEQLTSDNPDLNIAKSVFGDIIKSNNKLAK